MRSTSPVAIARRSAISAVVASTSTYSRSQETGNFTSELAQDAEVVLPQEPERGQAVAQHGDALKAHAEREAGPLLGIKADELEERRVDHPGAGDLDPARVAAHRAALALAEKAAHVRLEGRFREWEVVRAEAHLALLAEERAHHVEQRALEVAHGDAAVDGEPFDLVEDRRVRRVRRVAPVDAAERDHVDRRRLRLHHADLRRRRLRPQQHVAVEEEGLERRARRVVRREVEPVEVVPGRLHLATVDNLVAEPEEDVLHLAADLGDQVQTPARPRLAGQRDVGDLLGEPAVEVGALELSLPLGHRALEPFAQRVEDAARLGVANLAQRLLQVAPAAQVANASLVELGEGRGARNRASRLAFQGLRVHRVSVSSGLCRPMTPSPTFTTPGAGASPRTWGSTSPRPARPARP